MEAGFESLLAVVAFVLGWYFFNALGKCRAGVAPTSARADPRKQETPGPSPAVPRSESRAEGARSLTLADDQVVVSRADEVDAL